MRCAVTHLRERPSANTDVKNSQGVIMIIINVIRTNYNKVRIYKTQQNSKCWLRGDREETINRIIIKCRKLAQKAYKTRHTWVGKLIHYELCKKLKFDQDERGPSKLLHY